MCGICGFIGNGDLDDLNRMVSTLFHRGPDDRGTWHDVDKSIYFGHTRLEIIDIRGGVQPMWTEDESLGIVFNGEIYNHLELRDILKKKGHSFKSDHSDTEVLLYGYREWGFDLPEKLNGMWAFAVYDKRKKQVFISRDRFGKKPLFYTIQKDLFVFGSEMSALTAHMSVRKSVSRKSLKKYFAYGYIPAPSSLYQNVYKLPGGYNLLFNMDDFSHRKWKYWDFVIEPYGSIPKNPEQEWGDELLDLLEKAVSRRLMSDVPLGVFLSGGIDSSSVTYFASQNSFHDKLKTFSIGFREKSFDESVYAKSVADFLNTDHQLKMLSMEEAKMLVTDIATKLDEPMGDSSLVPTFLLSRETRKHVTVALGGDGADELFAGYDPFRALNLANIYDKIISKPIHRAIRMLAARLPTSHRNMSLDFKFKRTLRGLSYPKHLWNSIWLGPLDPEELEDLFEEPSDLEDIYSEAIEYWDVCSQDNIGDRTLQFYTKLYLQDDILVKVDRASMMNSLEVRSPFLDIDLVNFIRRIPFSWKYRNGQTKYILKKSLERVLPKSVIYRSKKGFGIPLGSWFKEGILPIKTDQPGGVLSSEFVTDRIGEHLMDRADHRAFLWNCHLLGIWNSKSR